MADVKVEKGNEIELYCGPDPNSDLAYELWLMYEEARGELAFVPETMGCFECGGYDGKTAPQRRVVKLGGISHAMGFYPTGESVDPYQIYELECGHSTI